MTEVVMFMRIEFENAKAARALGRASQLIAEMADDFPYRPEMAEAVKAMRYAMRHITVKAGR